MSGGHGHGGHDDHGHGGHGHDAHGGHGHDAHGGDHGPAEIPPVPETRSISPARSDYAQPWPGRLLLWPVLWLVVAAAFFLLARGQTGTVVQGHGHGHEGDEHAPADGHGH
ncbi:MAG: hypothetical protein IT460_11475 [Planctomycetes bacterium]|nr:hypothetical protein [Planctomycetota bacterium]